MAEITRELRNPDHQYPLPVFFLGQSTKSQALRALFPRNNITRRADPGIARLHLSSSTAYSQHPVWIVDGVLKRSHAPLPSKAWRRYSLPLIRYRTFEEVQRYCYARFILPFVDVLCLFADDLGGLAKVHEALQAWIDTRTQNPVTGGTRPQIVVVQSAASEAESFLRDVVDHPQYSQCFRGEPLLLNLCGRQTLSAGVRFEPLRTTIVEQLQLARNVRVQQRLLFSAVHLNALINAVIRHQARPSGATFDVVLATRRGNEVDDALGQHLATFHGIATNAKWPEPETVSFIASALLLDAYPPQMHRKSTRSLFDRIRGMHQL